MPVDSPAPDVLAKKVANFVAWRDDPRVQAVLAPGSASVYFAMKIGLPFVEQATDNYSLAPWKYESGLDAVVKNAVKKAWARGFATVDEMLEDIVPAWAEPLL